MAYLTENKKWYVVRTKPREELKAIKHLHEQGFVTFMPRCRAIKNHARKTIEVLAPLFPGYFFIEMDIDNMRWQKVNATRGVASLVQFGNVPSVVGSSVVEYFKKLAGKNDVVPLSSLDIFKVGDEVKIVSGSFKGYTATYKAMNSKERVNLLLNLLGREVGVALDAVNIKAA